MIVIFYYKYEKTNLRINEKNELTKTTNRNYVHIS